MKTVKMYKLYLILVLNIFVFHTKTTVLAGMSEERDDQYFRIQSLKTKKYLVAPSSSSLNNDMQLENGKDSDDSQVWLIHPTAGFPFRDGNFSLRYKISSKNSNYELKGQSNWQLTFVQRHEQSGADVYTIVKPYRDVCLVETDQIDGSTSLELEDCDKTWSNKLWIFLPAGAPDENTDFDSNSSKEM